MDAPPVSTPPVSAWHALSAAEVARTLHVEVGVGLSQEQAARRLEQLGGNSLPPPRRRGPWVRFGLQFHNPLIYVLLLSSVGTFALEDYVDTGVIVAVVLVNALIGFIQEGKAEKALEAVSALLARRATVLRDGERRAIDADLLVPGDVVLVESGTLVPADLRLSGTKDLRVDEATLTGESVPVDKGTEPVASDAPVGDRSNMVYCGTVVSLGQGQGIVVGTGAATELGRIGTLVGEVSTLATPLTRRLDQFARQITIFILVVGLITLLFGHFVRGMPMLDIFLAVVGVAVAAIPEGLPAIVTIVLAIGTRAMARNHALVRRLPAVETLGSVTVICTDKTGTLTRNEMTAVRVMLPRRSLEVSGVGYAPEGGFRLDGAPDGSVALDSASDEALCELARCALLCNDARLQRDEAGDWQIAGDPTDGALLTLAGKAGLDLDETLASHPRLDVIPFESQHRLMATLHHDHAGRTFALIKGACEQVFELCAGRGGGQTIDTAAWTARMEEAARAGERVLALAHCDMPAGTIALSMSDLRRPLRLLGLVGLTDPPREEAIAAVAECRRAGLQVKMITGDHVGTACAIGRQFGLRSERALSGEDLEAMDDEMLRDHVMQTDVIARASPEHKLRLIAALQSQGELVAMTGDGVNDAPALKAADIGVAMGHKGTDAAREAADLVLTDDNFATIARAVREGRVVLDNIKKSLLFILPTDGGEACVILLAVFAGTALPITAGQVLWVNMVTAVTLSLALAFEPAEPGVMTRAPRRPSEPLITRVLALRIAYGTLLMVAVTFAVFEWELARGSRIEVARTAAVNMLAFAELVYLFNVRSFTAHAFHREIFSGNPVAVWVSLVLIVFQLLYTYAPPLQQVFQSAPLDTASWLLILVLGAAKFLAVEAEKAVLRHLRIRSM